MIKLKLAQLKFNSNLKFFSFPNNITFKVIEERDSDIIG